MRSLPRQGLYILPPLLSEGASACQEGSPKILTLGTMVRIKHPPFDPLTGMARPWYMAGRPMYTGLMSPGLPVPYDSLWLRNTPPQQHTPGTSFMVRNTFWSSIAGRLLGIQYFRYLAEGANHFGFVVQRGAAGQRRLLRGVSFPPNAAGAGLAGWQTVYFASLDIPANTWYDVVVEASGGSYGAWDNPASPRPWSATYLVFPADGSVDPFGITVPNGAIATNLSFNPNVSLAGQFVGADVLFIP